MQALLVTVFANARIMAVKTFSENRVAAAAAAAAAAADVLARASAECNKFTHCHNKSHVTSHTAHVTHQKSNVPPPLHDSHAHTDTTKTQRNCVCV
jgi:hypothetical protein